jgi:hypothetical protein
MFLELVKTSSENLRLNSSSISGVKPLPLRDIRYPQTEQTVNWFVEEISMSNADTLDLHSAQQNEHSRDSKQSIGLPADECKIALN